MADEPEVQLASVKTRSLKSHEPGISWLVVIVLMVALALAVMHFGQRNPVPVPTPGTSSDNVSTPIIQPRIYTITYNSGVFSPTNLRIHAGDTVRFKNESIFPIRIVSDDLVGFDSIGDIPQGSYFSFTFAARGTFSYRNGHNNDQTGSIIVR